MRVIFFTSKLNFETAGGSVPDLDLKVRTLLSFGHNTTVLTVFSERNTYRHTLPYEVINEQLSPKMNLYQVQKGVYQLMKKHQHDTDIFHVEGQFVYAAGIYKMLGGKTPVVIFYNREAVTWIPLMGVFKKTKRLMRVALEKTLGAYIANHVDHYIFTNPNLQKEYFHFGLSGKFSIMPDFVDPKEKYAAARMSTPNIERRGDDKKKIMLFTSGRMIPEKGFELTIRALALLKHKERFQLTISGDGPEKDKLERLSKKLGLAQSISFPGWVPKNELATRLSTTDIFILPKWRMDLTSVLLLEAMIFAAPCVVPGKSAIAWVAGAGGMPFEDNNAEDLAKKIEELVEQPELRIKLSRGCLERIRELNHVKMGHELERIMFDLQEMNNQK